MNLSEIEIRKKNFLKMYSISCMLNDNILTIGDEILKRCVFKDIKISRTSQNELLIYTEKNGRFYNLLIDDDGDISFLLIGKRPEETKTEFFSSEKGFDFDYICSLI